MKTPYYKEITLYKKLTKEYQLITNGAREYLSSLALNSQPVIADIGSGRGVLIGKILAQIDYAKLYLTEPDEGAFYQLKNNFAETGDVKLENLPFIEWMDKHKDSQFDIIWNIHTFYHYQQRLWIKLINNSLGLLTDQGRHIIILDSHKGTFHQWRDRVTSMMNDVQASPQFGQYVLGQDLRKALDDNQIEYDYTEFAGDIEFSQFNQEDVLHAISFIHRFPVNDVRERCQDLVTEMQNAHKKVRDVQEIIAIKK